MSEHRFGLAVIVLCITALIAWLAYTKGHEAGLKKAAMDNRAIGNVEIQRLMISTLKAERDSKEAELKSYDEAIKTAEQALSELQQENAERKPSALHVEPSPSQ